MLEGLTIQMKDVGYVANWDFEIEDCDLRDEEVQGHICDLFHMQRFEEVGRFDVPYWNNTP